jgi:hypothetical protein
MKLLNHTNITKIYIIYDVDDAAADNNNTTTNALNNVSKLYLSGNTARTYFRNSNELNSVMIIIIFSRIAGVSMYSTVPTDEFDFFEEMTREAGRE